MDLFSSRSTVPAEGGQELVCSAKGCRAVATQALLWNNPTLHTPDRRKVWLACDTHTRTLGSFLAARSFLVDTIPVADLDETHG